MGRFNDRLDMSVSGLASLPDRLVQHLGCPTYVCDVGGDKAMASLLIWPPNVGLSSWVPSYLCYEVQRLASTYRPCCEDRRYLYKPSGVKGVSRTNR